MNPEIEFREKYHPDYSGMKVEERAFASMYDYEGVEKEYRLDFIVPENADETICPCIIFLHGGGFCEPCDKRQSYISVFARFLHKAGYTVVSPDYPLFTSYEAREAWGGLDAGSKKTGEAVHLAYRYLIHHATELHIDPERIALMGGSAGAMGGFYAISAYHEDHYKAFINLWGAPDPVPDVSAFPPTLSVHGNCDRLLSYNREMPVQIALEKAGISHDLITVVGGDHTPLMRMDDYLPQVIEWLKQYL